MTLMNFKTFLVSRRKLNRNHGNQKKIKNLDLE